MNKDMVDPDLHSQLGPYTGVKAVEDNTSVADAVKDTFLTLACCGDYGAKVFELVNLSEDVSAGGNGLFFGWKESCNQ